MEEESGLPETIIGEELDDPSAVDGDEQGLEGMVHYLCRYRYWNCCMEDIYLNLLLNQQKPEVKKWC